MALFALFWNDDDDDDYNVAQHSHTFPLTRPSYFLSLSLSLFAPPVLTLTILELFEIFSNWDFQKKTRTELGLFEKNTAHNADTGAMLPRDQNRSWSQNWWQPEVGSRSVRRNTHSVGIDVPRVEWRSERVIGVW